MKLTDAMKRAEKAILARRQAAPELSGYDFGAIKLERENEQFWTFAACSHELIEQGFAPGALFASIDKFDGHLLSDEEIEAYARARAVESDSPERVAA